MTTGKSKSSAVSERSETRTYQCLFQPRSIAVIGASGDPLKPGGRVFKNILEHGYRGNLWPVNPKAATILGVAVCPSIASLPEPPDLAIVAIPASMVEQAVAELAEGGAGAVIVLTSGFGEKDAAGKEVERRLRHIADVSGMALIGPNCSGFLTAAYKGKFAGIVPKLPGRAVDFISGSGATVDYVMECAEGRGLSFGTVINLGNSAQMGVEDLVKVYDENYGPEAATILLLYMEAVKKPLLLLRHAKNLGGKGCAVAAIKAGATSAGSRAAASHTGAMATDDTAVQALFDKAGIIRVTSREELVDVACVLRAAGGMLRGRRVCVVTDAGGPGVMLADELARGGMTLPVLSETVQAALAHILPPESSLINPIDTLPSRTAGQIAAIVRVLGEHEWQGIDAVAILTGDSGLSDNAAIYQAIGEAMDQSPIPVLPMLSSLTSCRDQIDEFTRGGRVFFPDEVALGRALGLVARRMPPGEDDPVLPAGYDRRAIGEILGQADGGLAVDRHGALEPAMVRQLITAVGIRQPGQVEVFEEEELAKACLRIGFPLAAKVVGPLHKTDVAGVVLGIENMEQVERAWSGLMAIPKARGVLLQPMVDGLEVILGVSRQGDFGHLVMFGLGGIHAEVLKDVCFSLAPLSADEAFRLIEGIRGRALLDGFRGGPGMDTGVLADYLVRLARLVTDFPVIDEIDLNPVKGAGDRLFAVDARVILGNSSRQQ